MRGGVNEDVSAHSRIRQDEANGVVDASSSKLVRAKEEWSDREARSVGTGALISASRQRIDTIQIPNCEKVGGKTTLHLSRLIGFVEFCVGSVGHDEVTVALIHIALVS